MRTKNIFALACCLVAVGIMLGAFAAHGLKDKVTPYQLDIFQKGVFYHLLHALGLVVIALNLSQFNPRRVKLAVWLLGLGILFFSGSLYLLATIDLNGLSGMVKVLGPVTPVGGLCFITGWLVLAFSYRSE